MVSDCVVTLRSHESLHSSNNFNRPFDNDLLLVGNDCFTNCCHTPGSASPPSASGSKQTMSRAAAEGHLLGPWEAEHRWPPRPDPQLVAFMSTRELKFAMMNEVG